MLFDCTALIVGLAAAVIAKWESNRLFSYGYILFLIHVLILCSYGRVEVLSGFINGIFLVFIAISIVVEAIERFYDPPEIDTDRLLMVGWLNKRSSCVLCAFDFRLITCAHLVYVRCP